MPRDHGGGIDAACQEFGGMRGDWLDLSTGINPDPYPIPDLKVADWMALPDHAAFAHLIASARKFWDVPNGADILAVPGCSAAIAQIPYLMRPGSVSILGPTYNEHEASFRGAGWDVSTDGNAHVIVHPNNPTGEFHPNAPHGNLVVIDESFCDIAPKRSHISASTRKGTLILKSFGKFWGLAGLRLGFVIGCPVLIAKLRDRLGPWAISGPALRIGANALADAGWALGTRQTLSANVARLDAILAPHGAKPMGSVSLFRTYQVADARGLYQNLAKAHILTRTFPYRSDWIRFGLPDAAGFKRLEAAL